MKNLSNFNNPRKRILFLGYDKNDTSIIDLLIDNQCNVEHTNKKISKIKKYDFVLSYGYRYILDSSIIRLLDCPIFNLHMSYLPFNRGANPNFWSFYDKTPSGVTLHIIDDGIDTGPIIDQKYVYFSPCEDTFRKTYEVLKLELEKLFEENLEALLSDKWIAKKQIGKGTIHFVKDLPLNFSGWGANINKEILKLNKEGLRYE